MKTVPNKLARCEKGQALLLVLILLLVGSLITTPLLGFMSTGLIVGQVHEKRMSELYAADAGVEHAFWQIKTDAAGLPGAGDDPWEYSIADVNGKQVNAAIAYIDDHTYKITSTASSAAGSSTTIESYTTILDMSSLMGNIITSIGDITLQPGAEATGNVQYNGELDNKGDINGEIITDEIEIWPTADQLAGFYGEDVEGLEPYPNNTIDLKNTTIIGPLYRDGDLNIKNTGNQTTAELNGTVYVTGNLTFEQPGGPKAYTIDLKGHTIYVEGSITFPAERCTLSGSGCIIAVGDVTFQPSILSDEDDFIFVMSVEGEVWFSPQGSFYGSVAGVTNVDLQPGSTLEWRELPGGLNAPGVPGSGRNVISAICTWGIS